MVNEVNEFRPNHRLYEHQAKKEWEGETFGKNDKERKLDEKIKVFVTNQTESCVVDMINKAKEDIFAELEEMQAEHTA